MDKIPITNKYINDIGSTGKKWIYEFHKWYIANNVDDYDYEKCFEWIN